MVTCTIDTVLPPGASSAISVVRTTVGPGGGAGCAKLTDVAATNRTAAAIAYLRIQFLPSDISKSVGRRISGGRARPKSTRNWFFGGKYVLIWFPSRQTRGR